MTKLNISRERFSYRITYRDSVTAYVGYQTKIGRALTGLLGIVETDYFMEVLDSGLRNSLVVGEPNDPYIWLMEGSTIKVKDETLICEKYITGHEGELIT